MSFGISRLVEDLNQEGFGEVIAIKDSNNLSYAFIPGYVIPAGTFKDKVIDLAIPAPDQYPRNYGACIHIRSNPPLVATGQQVQNVRNVQASALGSEWQYWSYAFDVQPANPTAELLTQINGIFRKN